MTAARASLAEHTVHVSSNLPIEPTPIIGRATEIERAVERLREQSVRLLTFTGPGGTGKTRLAIAVATVLRDDFRDGVFMVVLAPIREPGLVIATIAHSLEVMEEAGKPILETLQSFLRDRQILLLLDNFEQVEAAAPYIATLMKSAPKLKVLITSRTLLRLAGEYEFMVPPLPLPDLTQLSAGSELAQNPAVMLFLQRAQAVRPGLQLTETTAPAIAEICCRLDGLPLAIELAAARCKILSPQALLARLASPLQLLTRGSPDLPERQQALRATIDWSYALLTTQEQTLFRRLAIFVGGWTLQAVEEVCTTADGRRPGNRQSALTPATMAVLDNLTAIVENSLVRQTEEADGEPRFNMLETIHEYALERLEESGEAPILQQLHVHFYLALAEVAEPSLTGSEQLAWLARLEREHDNLRAALTACKSLAAGAELGLRLAAALWWFWWVRGHLTEGRAWLETLLAQTATAMPSQHFVQIRATALYRAGFMACLQDEYRRANTLAEESLTLFRSLNDARGIGWAHYVLGLVATFQGDHARAKSYAEECLLLFRALGDSRGISWVLNDLGNLAMMQGDLSRAVGHYQESLMLSRALGNVRDIASSLGNLSGAAVAQGDLPRAVAYSEEVLGLLRTMGDIIGTAITLHSLGYIAQLQGDLPSAQSLFVEAFQLYNQSSNRFGIARCLAGLAAVATATGNPLHAAQLLGAAAAQHDNLASFLELEERARYEQSLAGLRTQLGEPAFTEAWTVGRAMTPAQALASLAPASVAPPPAPTTPPPPSSSPLPSTALTSAPLQTPPTGLSERELEVLRLLARGLSYTEIAEQLVISPRTVNRHLTSVYTKLNVSSRHAATRYALDHGLA
jgi:predicted ATPase/DNA-binding CsgD family transcriptional regulator